MCVTPLRVRESLREKMTLGKLLELFLSDFSDFTSHLHSDGSKETDCLSLGWWGCSGLLV